MVKDEYSDSFSVCFNMMKMKYSSYDKDIDEARFLAPDDKVNVFISFETVMKYLASIKDIDRKLVLEREFPVIIASGALNLIAHYKRFFRQNGLQTRVFLYYTDPRSDEYVLYDKNDEYRSYYTQKFLRNPHYSMLGESLVDIIIPEIKTICNFINGVYFISAKNFEGSLIPMIIGGMDPSWKNCIITGDAYDTQYQMYPNKFLTHYLSRGRGTASISFDIKKSAQMLFFDKEGTAEQLDIISNNVSFYCLLLAAKGSKIRSIENIKGCGAKTIMKYIMNSISSGNITRYTTSIDLITDSFPDDIKEFILANAYCTSLENQYKNLSREDRFSIESQLVDRYDNNSLVQLNSRRYYHHQLMLPELTM